MKKKIKDCTDKERLNYLYKCVDNKGNVNACVCERCAYAIPAISKKEVSYVCPFLIAKKLELEIEVEDDE